MMWTEDILDFLESKSVGEKGVNLFRDHMPETVSSGVLLASLMPINQDLYVDNYYKGPLQIVCRDRDGDAAVAKANSVIAAIGDGVLDLPSVRFLQFRAKHAPLIYPKSTAGLVEASVNFDLILVLK